MNDWRVNLFLRIRTWGTEGSANGQFKFPTHVALGSSGNVYVVDSNNDRIQVFNNGGTFIRTWGSAGSANGLFNTPFGIAIDSSGNANVSDIENKNNRIQKFKKDGTFIRTCTEG